MKPEAYRRMKVAGRLFVLIGLSIPAVLILLLFLRLGELVVLAARECAVLAVVIYPCRHRSVGGRLDIGGKYSVNKERVQGSLFRVQEF
jgi:hypothetical protein